MLADDLDEGESGHARAPAPRAAPQTLEDHLARGYAARFQLDGSQSEAVELVVIRLANAGFPRPKLEAERLRLAAVEARCIVSRTGREILELALSVMPPG